MTQAVLDASALLAMLLDERGAEIVRPLLADSAMSTINLAEVVGHYARNGANGDDIHDVLDALPIERVDFDSELAFAVGLMLPISKSAGLSLGDRACLALAMKLGVPAFTADRSWAALSDVDALKVNLIR